jgi:hypothetical protein
VPFAAAVNIAPEVDIAGVSAADPLRTRGAQRGVGSKAGEVDSFVNELDALVQGAGDVADDDQ